MAVPHLDHVFVIVEENNGFHDVIGNPAAPNLNALARTFGLANDYFGVSHPSEPGWLNLARCRSDEPGRAGPSPYL